MTTAHTEHLDDETLIFHYYGEPHRRALVEIHLASCHQCAAAYEDIVATLALVSEESVPERGDHYGLEVWQRLRPELPARRSWWTSTLRLHPAASVGAALLLSGAGFLVGRQWEPASVELPRPLAASVDTSVSERVRLAAIADHLGRSERVLLDLTNGGAAPHVENVTVSDLLDDNRLYRDAAADAGDSTVAGVLDDLERALLDIVHAPTTMTPDELAVTRTRLDAATLLFKIRILSMELRDRESTPVAPRTTT